MGQGYVRDNFRCSARCCSRCNFILSIANASRFYYFQNNIKSFIQKDLNLGALTLPSFYFSFLWFSITTKLSFDTIRFALAPDKVGLRKSYIGYHKYRVKQTFFSVLFNVLFMHHKCMCKGQRKPCSERNNIKVFIKLYMYI